MPNTKPKPAFEIGENVRVNGENYTMRRDSKIAGIRQSIGCPQRLLYILDDGGWLDESELESLEWKARSNHA